MTVTTEFRSDVPQRAYIHRGSVKEIYAVKDDPHLLDFVHTDRISMFDRGPHQQQIPGMGESLCACTCATFRLAEVIGVPTHFVKQIDSRTMRVRRFSLEGTGDNRIIPLELIDRDVAAGSLCRDVAAGRKDPRDFGFATSDSLPEGTPLKWPIHQITTKRERIDRPLTTDEALRIGNITPAHLDRIWSLIDKLNGAIALAACRAGFVRLDGKKEVALGVNGEIIIADSAGTFFEDRFAPTSELIRGVVVHYSKEYLRQIFITNGFFGHLQAARAAGEPEPEYPDFTDEQMAEATRRFTELAEKYAKAVEDITGRH